MMLIAQSTVVVMLLTLLLIVDPLPAIGVGVVLALAYSVIFAIVSGWLKQLGQWQRARANQDRFGIVNEAFSANKEVKVGGLEQAYVQLFAKSAEINAKVQATAQAIAQIPRYVLEAIAFGGMLLVTLYLMAKSGSFASAIPVIALYAFAGYRLLPALQQVYHAFTQLRFISPALDTLFQELEGPSSWRKPSMVRALLCSSSGYQAQKVNYRYPNASEPALKGVNIEIPANSKVGFVGATGSGKTTAVDVILGLADTKRSINC